MFPHAAVIATTPMSSRNEKQLEALQTEHGVRKVTGGPAPMKPNQQPQRSAASDGSVWLTDISQISTASIESLERSLITSDGRGKEVKRAALDELKSRISSLAADTTDTTPVQTGVPLPPGIPAPPKGFVFAGMDRLANTASPATSDIAWFSGNRWLSDCCWHGDCYGPWAVRIGSDIAKANGHC